MNSMVGLREVIWERNHPGYLGHGAREQTCHPHTRATERDFEQLSRWPWSRNIPCTDPLAQGRVGNPLELLLLARRGNHQRRSMWISCKANGGRGHQCSNHLQVNEEGYLLPTIARKITLPTFRLNAPVVIRAKVKEVRTKHHYL